MADGKISSAAKASFLTLSHAPGKGFWLWLYLNLPGFAFISEKSYALIAAHRSFFYFFSILFWGRNYVPPQYLTVSWVFLRLFGLIYLAAFISFGVQALGLIGSQGILPLTELIQAGQNQLNDVRYWLLPMVFWFNSSDLAIQAVCWGGVALSLLLIFNVLPRISLLGLYLLYLSLVYAGQVFMTFQWDLYILETGVLALFLVSASSLGIWLMRWLLFRFIFAGGLVKLWSGDPTWQNYTALDFYFETEPLPTPLAWYAHHLPHSWLQFSTAATLFIELFIPFLIFFPRNLRYIAAFFILLMQTVILLTGNYNFFNILTILLCLTLFDDAALSTIIPKRLMSYMQQRVKKLAPRKLFVFFTIAFVLITVPVSIAQFEFRFLGRGPTSLAILNNLISPFDLVNGYGPFAVITTDRMEIIIEGSNDGENWREYAFKYKPGDLNKRPPWNIPHQPRLDWQMWFAALSEPENNPWFVRFLKRLLEGSSEVLALLESNPFPDKPPQQIRAQFYQYYFTTPEEREKTGAWWSRRLVRRYFP